LQAYCRDRFHEIANIQAGMPERVRQMIDGALGTVVGKLDRHASLLTKISVKLGIDSEKEA
jgi:hypothetical protein